MSTGHDTLNHIFHRLLEPVERISALNAPKLISLAHYTSHPVLEGIVKNKELWFSRVSEMNDVDEVQSGKRMIVQFATDDSLVGRSMFAIKNWDEALWSLIRDEFEERIARDFDDTFISCWSANYSQSMAVHDDLTMWRAYGGDGEGVAIIIDPTEVHIGQGELEIIACPVFYETEDAFHQRAAEFFRTFAVNLLSLDIPRPVPEDIANVVVETFSQLCFYLAITHKHPGFAEEKEWRFVWKKDRYTDSSLDHYLRAVRVGNRTLQKFCLPLNRSEEFAFGPFHLHDVLKCVICGPSENAVSNLVGVKQLLNDHGYDPNRTMAVTSSIPYRAKK